MIPKRRDMLIHENNRVLDSSYTQDRMRIIAMQAHHICTRTTEEHERC